MQLSCVDVGGSGVRISAASMASVRRRRVQAALALLCLAALFFGDVARGIHLLTARHVVCAAHGELVEADSLPGSGSVEADDVSALPTGDDEDHHEHCSVAAVPTRPLATELAEASLTGVAQSDECVVTFTAARTSDGRSVLAYAPKQGPPANDG